MNESTIYIFQGSDDPVRNVRCLDDGNLLLEFKGKIVYLIVGLSLPPQVIKTTSNAYIRVKCKRCHTFYNIMIQNI